MSTPSASPGAATLAPGGPSYAKNALGWAAFQTVPVIMSTLMSREEGDSWGKTGKQLAKASAEPAILGAASGMSMVLGRKLAEKSIAGFAGGSLGAIVLGEAVAGAAMGLLSGAIGGFRAREKGEGVGKTTRRMAKEMAKQAVTQAAWNAAFMGGLQLVGVALAGARLRFKNNKMSALKPFSGATERVKLAFKKNPAGAVINQAKDPSLTLDQAKNLYEASLNSRGGNGVVSRTGRWIKRQFTGGG